MAEVKYDESTSLQCVHPSSIKDKCINRDQSIVECGNQTTLPFGYLEPNLNLTLQEIQHRRDVNLQSLLSRKKLHLVLDLDHTLVHAKAYYDELTSEEAEHIQTMDEVYWIFFGAIVVKLRPGVREFLEQVSSMFDLSVYTMSEEQYATKVVKLLDYEEGPSRFSSLICYEHFVKKNQKVLDIVLSHEKVILIVDDTESVWSTSGKENLVRIGQYIIPLEEAAKGVKEARGMDKELARVLSILKEVHKRFYDDEFEYNDADYSKRDVREVLRSVLSDKNEAIGNINLSMKKFEL